VYEIGLDLLQPRICQVRHAFTSMARLPRSLQRRPPPTHSHATSERTFTTHQSLRRKASNPAAPSPTASRGPASEEDTQTDFAILDVLGNTPAPSTSIDACIWDGFHLNSGVKVVGGAGVLLVGGEAFAWRPWAANKESGSADTHLLNRRGQWEVGDDAWGLLRLMWPKPGKSGRFGSPSPETLHITDRA